MRWSLCSALMLASLAAPASAARWEQYDRFNWIDLDSVQRISGGLVTYRAWHGDGVPSGDVGSPWGLHCADFRWYWMDKGQLAPVPDEPDLDPYFDETHPLYVKLCR